MYWFRENAMRQSHAPRYEDDSYGQPMKVGRVPFGCILKLGAHL